MRLEINGEGKIVIRGVSDGAWEYIEGERNKRPDPQFDHWYFSRRYGETVYLTVTAQEDKTEFVRHIDKLIGEYGMQVTKSAEQILYAWRRDAAYTFQTERTNRERRALQAQIEGLKRVLCDGCKDCPHFLSERNGDDEDGYCTAKGKRALPVVFVYPFRAGEPFSTVKFYPCETCVNL